MSSTLGMSLLRSFQVRNRERIFYKITAIIALGFGIVAVESILQADWIWALSAYVLATGSRLLAGSFMNGMGDGWTVRTWNNKYHRLLVVALNSGIGVVLLGRLIYDWLVPPQPPPMLVSYSGALTFLTLVLISYFIAAHFTRPNSFGARVRSATLTVMLIAVMAYLALRSAQPLFLFFIVDPLLAVAWALAVLRLQSLQRRFGWTSR